MVRVLLHACSCAGIMDHNVRYGRWRDDRPKDDVIMAVCSRWFSLSLYPPSRFYENASREQGDAK